MLDEGIFGEEGERGGGDEAEGGAGVGVGEGRREGEGAGEEDRDNTALDLEKPGSRVRFVRAWSIIKWGLASAASLH